jgi:hypothetical protein
VGSYLAARASAETGGEALGAAGSGEGTAGSGSRSVFPGIEDADIHLFIVESYGMTVFTNPHQYGRLERYYREAEASLREAGFSIASYAYQSTAFGGTSWLADGSLITGLRLDSQHKYSRAVEEGRRNLLHILDDAGYTRLLSAPGSTFMDREHRRFYDFDRYLLYEDFDYEGPYFTYGRMPDQFQLARAAQVIFPEGPGIRDGDSGSRRAGSAPLFAEYMLCSSHVPWNYIPPYLPAWHFPDDGRVYYDRSSNTFYETPWTAGSEVFEGYAHSIGYSLRSVFGYVSRFLEGDELIVLIGDHQPAFPVSERGASFAVPIHVISRSRDAVQLFYRYGYGEGLRPPQGEQEFPGIERFLPHFMSIASGRVSGIRPPGAPHGTPR